MYRLSSVILLMLAFMQAMAQSPHGDSFKIDCASCHSASGWAVVTDSIKYNHNETNFALSGIHTKTDCKACHVSSIFSDAPSQCSSCHTDVHTMSVGNDCSRCHTTNSWLVDNIPELHEESGFALTGSHSNLSCVDCHRSETNLRFDRIGNDCINCHQKDFLAAKDPDHSTGGFSTNCIECHDPVSNGWNSDNFNHEFFPLVQGHAINDCRACHQTTNFSDASSACNSCHMQDFNATTNPNHTAAHFPTDCAVCHNIIAWTPTGFDHSNFPLLGGHAAVTDCNDCHHNNYVNTPNTCNACHMPDYTATTNPNHNTAHFPTDCAICHDENAWTPSSFDHSGFPLLGSHASITDCNDCHHNSYISTPNTCNACHMPDYTATTNPNHSSANFPTDCAVCHNESAWIPSGFNHTMFPLTGGHANVTDCNDCHHNNYVNTPNTCNACHMPDYTATTNPNHGLAQFPTDCAICHSDNGWIPSSFDHSSFPLLGSHAAITNCNDCHHGTYTNTPNTCNACHNADYVATTNPNHSAAQFPTDCAICHNETAWIPSGFTHSIYPLVGSHATITNCNDCHHGNFTNTPNTCAGCHMPDYNATTNPNHSASQFSTNCTTCHDETGWTPSSFDHDALYFPIYSGKHQGKWSTCTDCHTNSSNYALFTCINCHEHNNQNSVNNDHNGVSGYTYTSAACYNCHPDGRK
ncbi:MAG: hypothetical protein KA444_07325 [Bacteroidia bacterium]|nr:hypothetical protein [Bacteroidia bacterium]